MKNKLKLLSISITAFMIIGCGGDSNSKSSHATAKICKDGYDVVYSIKTDHPSAALSSSSNKVYFRRFCQRDRDFIDINDSKGFSKKLIGSFTNNPTKYKMHYSYSDRPKYGYDVLDYYSGTEYYGLSERHMYASRTKTEFINKIQNDIGNNDCKRYAANTAGGNFESSNNFWTYFCPQKDLILDLNKLD